MRKILGRRFTSLRRRFRLSHAFEVHLTLSGCGLQISRICEQSCYVLPALPIYPLRLKFLLLLQLPPSAFAMPQKCVGGRALLLKELTALPQIYSWIWGAASRRRREKERICEGIGKRDRKEKGRKCRRKDEKGWKGGEKENLTLYTFVSLRAEWLNFRRNSIISGICKLNLTHLIWRAKNVFVNLWCFFYEPCIIYLYNIGARHRFFTLD